MKILFLGGMFPENKMKEISNKSYGVIQNAANVLQWNIINGLRDAKNVELDLVSALFVGSWPIRYKDFYIHGNTVAEGEMISFVNLPVYKNISRYLHVLQYIKRWLKNNYSGEQIVIMAYSAHTPFIKALKKMKRKYNVLTHLVVPDLPEYMNLGVKSGRIKEMLKKIDIYIQKKNLDGIDSFTFLTKYMSEKYNIYNKPYVVVEGMVNDKECINFTENNKVEEQQDENIQIVYTGTMNIRYGVMDLVDAMKFIENKNAKLILCGTGDGVEKICTAAKYDDRIVYCGQVRRDEAIMWQNNATILVNPRSGEEEYTKFSFPSKNLEYMLHNKPVIVFKLEGIPDEYDQVLSYFRDNNPKHMAEDIMWICSLPKAKQKEMGNRITKFALEQKNCCVQAQKILQVCKIN